MFVLWLKLVVGRGEMDPSRRVAGYDYVDGINGLLLVALEMVGGVWV